MSQSRVGTHGSVPCVALQVRTGAGGSSSQEAGRPQVKEEKKRSHCPPPLLESSLWPAALLQETPCVLGE